MNKAWQEFLQKSQKRRTQLLKDAASGMPLQELMQKYEYKNEKTLRAVLWRSKKIEGLL